MHDRAELGRAVRALVGASGLANCRCTADRWRELAGWGRRDLSLAWLAEGHFDAIAILAEAGNRPAPGALYGVWAARPGGTGPRLCADHGGPLMVDGVARFCSGADLLDRALLVADASGVPPALLAAAAAGLDPADSRVLVEVDPRQPGAASEPDSWQADAMADSDTLDVRFAAAVVDPVVGGPGWYVRRPGFVAGGGGVAAVWWGGAAGLVDRVCEYLAGVSPDAHQLAHLGELHALLAGGHALVLSTARRIDEDRRTDHSVGVATLRSLVERVCRETVDRVPRMIGPGGWNRDRWLARQLGDLQMYVRQHHGERDHAELGRQLLAGDTR